MREPILANMRSPNSNAIRTEKMQQFCTSSAVLSKRLATKKVRSIKPNIFDLRSNNQLKKLRFTKIRFSQYSSSSDLEHFTMRLVKKEIDLHDIIRKPIMSCSCGDGGKSFVLVCMFVAFLIP